MLGKVITFTGRFGFIATDAGNVYFRAADASTIERGDNVRYDTANGPDGRPRAVNVRAVDPAAVAEVDRVFGNSDDG
ncbi:cold shock domain-containing protein [Mesorhizobium sp. AR07]|uniref:cold-shock protein n=1 Tax=Mesorhizobium sp. AR07 TaxID=2865838 RepID=UPI00215F202E|nr:cold shock domain-containing protein [Mesorhizobium sp. AR07]UVK44836.1 cold shock domain-containing protein [Mesorhizobium sp. AR07]